MYGKKLLGIIICFLFLFMISQDGISQGKKLRIALVLDVEDFALDGISGNKGYSRFISRQIEELMFNSLFKNIYSTKRKSSIFSELADINDPVKEIDTSVRGGTINIPVKKGIKWSDNTELTAEDVAYTLEVLKNPDNKYLNKTKYEAINSWKTGPNNSISITFERNYNPDLSILDFKILQKYKNQKENNHTVGDKYYGINLNKSNVCGTGPYKFHTISSESGSNKIIFKRNEYFGISNAGKLNKNVPYFEEVIISCKNHWSELKNSLTDDMRNNRLDMIFDIEYSSSYDKISKNKPFRRLVICDRYTAVVFHGNRRPNQKEINKHIFQLLYFEKEEFLNKSDVMRKFGSLKWSHEIYSPFYPMGSIFQDWKLSDDIQYASKEWIGRQDIKVLEGVRSKIIPPGLENIFEEIDAGIVNAGVGRFRAIDYTPIDFPKEFDLLIDTFYPVGGIQGLYELWHSTSNYNRQKFDSDNVDHNFDEWRKRRGSNDPLVRGSITGLIEKLETEIVLNNYGGLFLYSRDALVYFNNRINSTSVSNQALQRGLFHGIYDWSPNEKK